MTSEGPEGGEVPIVEILEDLRDDAVDAGADRARLWSSLLDVLEERRFLTELLGDDEAPLRRADELDLA